MGTKRTTMKDIAAEIGVSVVTISKAMAGKEGVSTALRGKILVKAKEMGYIPRKKKTLGDNLTLNVAIIISERLLANHFYYFFVYQKILMRLSEKGYIGILEIITREAEEVGELPNVMRLSSITQIIVIGEMKTLFLEMLVHTGVGIIFFDFQKEKFDVDCIVGDNENGGFLLTRYLVKCGYSRIGFVGNYLCTRKRQECFLGYIKYLMRKGQIVNRDWWIADKDEKGRKLALKFPEDMPDAFVCCNDTVAYRLIDALMQTGRSVPEDVAVVGCGDYVRNLLPDIGLTTYRMNMDEMVDQCIHIVEQRARKRDYRRGTSIINGQLVIRDSVRVKIDF